jgi:hypothetical protein
LTQAFGFTRACRGREVLDRGAWIAFLGLIPPLWASVLWPFVHSGPGRRTKAVWSLFLVALGFAIGLLFPLSGIRHRALVLLALLPALAFIDIKLAGSRRTFLFWLRAYAFEVCTVFACSALTRLVLGRG